MKPQIKLNGLTGLKYIKACHSYNKSLNHYNEQTQVMLNDRPTAKNMAAHLFEHLRKYMTLTGQAT